MGLNTKLKELKIEMDASFTRIAEASRKAYMETLPANARIPETNRIYGDAYKNQFSEKAAEIRGNVYSAIQEERERISKAKTEAPSAEAVNSIELMKLTTDITANDIRNMVSRYGDNYGAYRAIASIAADAGIKSVCGTHPLDKVSDGLDYVEQKVASNFSTTDYLSKGVQNVSKMGFDAIVDNELPE